ncbi:MAG: YHS domain-containing (seleno)protein [Bacteroidota bacterium]
MKNALLFFAIALLAVSGAWAQEHTNLKGGFGAQGYDVVSYFRDEPLKGNKKISAQFEGVTYKFASEENKTTFLVNPALYIPQYGGFCAYAIAKNGKKVGVDPKTYTITNGKLYLFYNSWGVNTLDKWNEEGAETLQQKADAAWNIVLEGQ